MIAVQAATSTAARPNQRFERKFFISPMNIAPAYMLMRQVCRPDVEYPEDQVNSLYFDTVDLDQFERSNSGDFRRDKIRIRWYGETGSYRETKPAFLELKSRQGFASSKKRVGLMVSAQQLELSNLSKGIIAETLLMKILAGFGFYPHRPLRPIIVISYWRYRFIEMMTGTRVSLDYKIRSSMVARDMGYGEHDLRLQGGVIEIKGNSVELPDLLKNIKILGADWSRLSKYASCVAAHLSGPSDTSRLLPSGITNVNY